MSFLSGIENAAHSTIAWLEKELTAIEKKAPTIERVIDAGLSYIAPVLEIALTSIGDGAAATVVSAVVAKAQSDLLVASALVTDFGPTPTASSIFASVKTNLSGLLTASQVTSAGSVAAVTKAVNEVGILATAVSTAATAIGAATVAPTA